MLLASEGLETTALEMPAVCSWVIALQVLVWGVPRVPGYTGRVRRVSGFEASDFFCCVAFLSIDGIAPKAVVSGVTQVDPPAQFDSASKSDLVSAGLPAEQRAVDFQDCAN